MSHPIPQYYCKVHDRYYNITCKKCKTQENSEIMKINDFCQSLETGKKGIIQASYPDGEFLLYHGDGYEHLFAEKMKLIKKNEVSPVVANSQVSGG